MERFMSIVTMLILSLAVPAAVLFGLAQYWARTPHGRLKPIFALAFKLFPLLNPADDGRAIGAKTMATPEEIAAARATFLKNTAPLSKPVDFKGSIRDQTLPGSPGGALPVRIYTPPGAGPFPLLVYFHGGGFVVGSPDYTDAVTRILASKTPAIVVSVDYRMAPEHPLPAAVDDCEFAVNYCFENAETFGARSGKIAVAGDSAGGNLAAVVAQRDVATRAHRIGLQVLIYPTVDASRTDRESQANFGVGYGLSLLDLDDCMRHYVPVGVDRAHPDVSPLHAKSLAGLPRAFVITAGFDVLRDEGIEYAEALRRAGVDVKHVNEPSLPHGFITMTRVCGEAKATLRTISEEIRAMSAQAEKGADR
jgi:acetyl esterase